MVTDWLHNERAVMLVPLIAATLCALVLAATRRRMPPEEPRWRLIRALVLIAFWIAGSGVTQIILGERAAYLLLPPTGMMTGDWLPLLARTSASAVFFAWLIPWGIEGRSLREMGWRRHHAVRYFLVAGLLTLVIASVSPLRGMPDDLVEALELPPMPATAILGIPSAMIWVLLLGFGFTAWTEENLFRGHLLPTLRETGMTGRSANMAQAAIFILMHIPGLIPTLPAHHAQYGIAGVIGTTIVASAGWWLWGLLFGWLRLRFDSIVPGFAVHGTWTAVRLARSWGGLFMVMHYLQD